MTIGIRSAGEKSSNEFIAEYDQWDRTNISLLENSFDKDEYRKAYEGKGVRNPGNNTGLYKNAIKDQVNYLRTLESLGGDSSPTFSTNATPPNKKVFIVHGHDNEVKQEVARFVEKLEFEAIILHEQANKGNTIIEKIEENADVGFAIVLYTPCDIGRAAKTDEQSQKSRARQNVVFEHGYLIARLGRERVCALVKGEVETPGDISGVVYIPKDDAGAWQMQITKDMKAAGCDVDLNKLA